MELILWKRIIFECADRNKISSLCNRRGKMGGGDMGEGIIRGRELFPLVLPFANNYSFFLPFQRLPRRL